MADKSFLTSSDIQREALRVLLAFDGICREQGWPYSLCGGTLLGAVRHKGFIPWDDDIDVSMPRPAFEEFFKTYQDELVEDEFALRTFPRLGDPDPLCFKFVTTRVKVHNRYLKDDDYLWIDVIPIDGLPEDLGQTRQIYKKAERYRRIAELVNADEDQGKTALRQRAKQAFKAFDSKGRISESCKDRLNRLARAIPYGSTDYVGAITWGLYGAGERMTLAGYERKVEVQFEGHSLPALSCWDEYLRGIYGNYMMLPPEEKRIHHEIVAWYA